MNLNLPTRKGWGFFVRRLRGCSDEPESSHPQGVGILCFKGTPAARGGDSSFHGSPAVVKNLNLPTRILLRSASYGVTRGVGILCSKGTRQRGVGILRSKAPRRW